MMTLILHFFISSLLYASGPLEETKDIPLSQKNSIETLQRYNSIERLLNFQNFSDGPNCWNTALIVSGLNNDIRYTDRSEYWHWMNSTYCEALPIDAELRFGDLGSIYNRSVGGNHFHSFMRVDHESIFQKLSPSYSDSWNFYPIESITLSNFFDNPEQCGSLNEREQIEEGCALRVVYHRCHPRAADFYSQYSDLLAIDLEVTRIALTLQRWMNSPDNGSQLFISLIQLGTLLEKTDLLRFQGEKEFARESMAFRIAGLLFTNSYWQSEHPLQVQLARIKAQYFFNRYETIPSTRPNRPR